MSEPVVAIVVAAGSGVRLGASAAGGSGPKALRLLDGISLVRRSCEAMAAGGVDSLVVVVAPGWADEFALALDGVSVPVALVPGGASRQESVQAGLAALPVGARIVLVHDAARPLVPAAVTRAVIAAVAAGRPVVIPVVDVVDSIRRVIDGASEVVDRSDLRAIQTPQGFDADVLRDAHARAAMASARGEHVEFTDDAGVCEAAGHAVTLVPGSRRSMKITEPLDFALATALVAQEEE